MFRTDRLILTVKAKLIYYTIKKVNNKNMLFVDCNGTRTHSHLVHKRTLNQVAKLTIWLSVCLQTKWLWSPVAVT